MKLLSLDISTLSTGYAVYVNNTLKEFGTVTNSKKDEILTRGNNIAEQVRLLVIKYGHFDEVAVEELKVISNQSVLVKLGIVTGMVVRELQDSTVTFLPPTTWRKTFGINGKREIAKKKAIDLCLKKGYNVKNDDEAEAILLGESYIFIKSK